VKPVIFPPIETVFDAFKKLISTNPKGRLGEDRSKGAFLALKQFKNRTISKIKIFDFIYNLLFYYS
jgi:hypothetical protein